MMMRRGRHFSHHNHHHSCDFPPARARPVFAVVLQCTSTHGRRDLSQTDLQDLMSGCPSKPENTVTFPSGPVAGKLFFRQWTMALDALAYFWSRCLDGPVGLPYPKVLSNVWVDSDKVEECDRLRALFASHARGLLCCELIRKLEKGIDQVSARINKVCKSLKDHNSMPVFCQLQMKKKDLEAEKEQLVDRLEEFRAAVHCIIARLEDPKEEDHLREPWHDDIDVFEFEDGLDWGRIHRVMLRECRRLEEGLPIYSFRRKILHDIYSNQVTVLIGETGSGKSTQLVQFLADSGMTGDGAIVCTQPRKIAAVSLAQWVSEESHGCYPGNFIASYPTYSSVQKFNSKVIFMTDRCLLQHCMNDNTLGGISCIIIDEAHERSLNTDLVLALIKKQLQRFDLRLIIMSATADASKLSDYFFGCLTFHVIGRNFPVDIKYIPNVSTEASWANITKQISENPASYVSDVVKMVSIIHKTEESGDILAFLTAQMEVEWACENFRSPSAVVLPLHGKLSCDEQHCVFQNYLGMRKIIFSTNLAETSLTIPGIKYVVDSGMVKDSRFEPGSGMNVLRVCRVSQSSAKQRAGRAGRTGPGKCYRLYSDSDFQSMPLHHEPEIQKVHLGIAVLKILALGITNVEDFDFVDAPNPEAVDMAIRNLIQLGAVIYKDDVLELTNTGYQLVKLGIEPRLGRIILGCVNCGLGKEGLVLAAVMANASSVFCRVGSDSDKLKADSLKVPFCHHDGDLFTLLSVYKEWEREQENRNKWCWENSINAKSMRRCQETILELENCLRCELGIIIPSYWKWDKNDLTCNKLLKNVILYSLSQNVAMYSGSWRLGYEVALTGEHVQLHPSCSLLIYGHKPDWVVFGDILLVSNKYLVCVTAIDHESLYTVKPPLLFDISELESRKMQMTVFSGLGNRLLRRLCGKANHNLHSLVFRIQQACKADHADVTVDFEEGIIQLFALSEYMETASSLANFALDCERKWLRNECIEKLLFHGGPNISPPVALLGSGAEIKHLELEKRHITVEISHPNTHAIDEKEFLMMVEQSVSGIASYFKHVCIGQNQHSEDLEKWGKITFLSPEAAEKAVNVLSGMQFSGSSLKVCPVKLFGGDHKVFPFHAVRAKVCWPRRRSKGVAFIKCAWQDVDVIVQDFSDLVIGGRLVRSEMSMKSLDCVIVGGIDKDVSEMEVYNAVRNATKSRIIDFWLLRGDAVDQPPVTSCEYALVREIAQFMPNKQNPSQNFWVKLFSPEPKDAMMKVMVTFDGNLHLEAAKALDHLQGKVLPGCLPWQKLECQQLFRSSVCCPPRVYSVIKEELDSVLKSFKHHAGVSYELGKNENGSYRVKLFANATKIIADLRRPLELMMKGKTISRASLTPMVLELLLSKEGVALMKSVEQETGTCILYDRQNLNVKVFGAEKDVTTAEERLIQALLSLHGNKQHEIPLRGCNLPPGLMKEVIRVFGVDLHSLKEMVPGAEFFLNTRRHILSVQGNKEQQQNTHDIVTKLAQSLGSGTLPVLPQGITCAICLCELEEPYKLEACRHEFCWTCLVEQCESAIKSHDGFPLCCAQEGCKTPILLADLRSMLPSDKLEELFRASLAAFVASSGGVYRFCPSPDCPSVYRVAEPEAPAGLFVCGACSVETCTKCHLEYHPSISCDTYKKFKEHPDSSLLEWRKGKEHVKACPFCGFTIEKIEGCNHISCRCGKHICWVCLESFESSDDCYDHLRSVHLAIQ